MDGTQILTLGLGLEAPWILKNQYLDTAVSPHRLDVSVHSATFCHPAKIRPKVTSQFPTRGYRHEKAPHTRPVAGFGQSAA